MSTSNLDFCYKYQLVSLNFCEWSSKQKSSGTACNYDYKITIIEGWQKFQLDNYLSSYYENYETIPYEDLIANTYIINSSNSISDLQKHLADYKKKGSPNFH